MTRNHPQSSLPPGFRFHPTDEELILHYLRRRIASFPLPVSIIAEVDIYKFDPWDLPAIATFGEKEWYFFTPRDRKYPNGARPNRAAGFGYWKATGTDKTIMTSSLTGRQQNVGVKKALVFYKGRPPKGTKTNWIMHEYRLAEALHHNRNNCNNNNYAAKIKDSSMRLDDWVLCRIYKKSHISSSTTISSIFEITDQKGEEEEEKLCHESINLPTSKSTPASLNGQFSQKSSSFSNLLDAMDYSLLGNFLSDNINLNPLGFDSHLDQPFFNNYNNMIDRTNNNSYLVNKLPGLSSSSHGMENRRKSTVDYDREMSNQSKKIKTNDSFVNNSEFEIYRTESLAKPSLLSPYDL